MASLLSTLTYPLRALGGLIAGGVGALLARKAKKDSAAPSDGERFFAQLLQGFGWWGTGPGGWSQDRVQQVTRFRHWVYAALTAQMDEIAGQTVQCAWRRSPRQAAGDRKRGKDFNYVRQKSRLRTKAMARLGAHEELELVDHDHPLLRLLHRPNPLDTYETLWKKIVMYRGLTGNAYVWKVPGPLPSTRDGERLPKELWVLPSHWVWKPAPTQEQINRGQLVSGYEIRPYGVRSQTGIVLPPEEVIHLASPHPLTPLDGFSPLTAGAEWVDIADAIDTARFSAMKQGIWPGLILKLMPEVNDPDDSTLARLRARFRELYQGDSNHGKPLVLGPGMDVAQATRAPAEMDFFQSTDQMRDMVLTLLRVPKAVLGISAEVNRASMEAAIALFYRGCITPDLRFYDGVFTEKLARLYDEDLLLFHENPTPDDPETLALEINTRAKNGAITPNEIRTRYGDEPYEKGGDDPLVPSTLRVLPLNTGKETPDPASAANAVDANANNGDQPVDDPAEDPADGPDGGDKKKKKTAPVNRLLPGTPEPSRNGHTRNGHARKS